MRRGIALKMAVFFMIVLFLLMNVESTFSSVVVNSKGRLIGNPCLRATPLTNNVPTNELWLKSAQLFAFCFQKVRSTFSVLCLYIKLIILAYVIEMNWGIKLLIAKRKYRLRGRFIIVSISIFVARSSHNCVINEDPAIF